MKPPPNLRITLMPSSHSKALCLSNLQSAKNDGPGLPVIQTARETGVFDTATAIGEAGDWPVVRKALELVLHRLRQDRALDVRILRRLGRELGIKVGRVQGISLQLPSVSKCVPTVARLLTPGQA